MKTRRDEVEDGGETDFTVPKKRRRWAFPVLILFVLLGGAGTGAIYYFGKPDGGIPKWKISLSADQQEPGASAALESSPTRHSEAEAAPLLTPPSARALALTPAPVAAVVIQSRQGPLPQIAKDGRTPMEIYARPFDMQDPRPRVALIVSGLGLSKNITANAITTLPPQVTLSFVPYPKDIQLSVDTARANGHEVVLEVPMEPFDYPHNDPGPYTLLTKADKTENLDKLEWIMSRFTGYSGLINDQGDKMLGAPDDLKSVLGVLKTRGLYFVDKGEAKRSVASQMARDTGVAFGISMASIDSSASREGIDLKLLQLEESARQNGSAIGIGLAYPVTIDRIASWAANLDAKGIALAPVSAVVSASSSTQDHR